MNAANPKQVRESKARRQRAQERYATSLEATLGTHEGRLVFWELIERLGTFRSVWEAKPDIGRLSYFAARQDVGREILEALKQVDRALVVQMEEEAVRRASEAMVAQALVEQQTESEGL